MSLNEPARSPISSRETPTPGRTRSPAAIRLVAATISSSGEIVLRVIR
jgi:hypothetical protein